MQWTDINWNPAKAILPYLFTRDTFIIVSQHKSPSPDSESTGQPLQSKQTGLFMVSYVTKSKVNRRVIQTSWRCNGVFTEMWAISSLPEQRLTEVRGYCMWSRKRVEGNDSELHTSASNGAVTVKHYKDSFDDSSGATSERIGPLQYGEFCVK